MGRRNDHSREDLREMIIGEARKLLGQHGQAGLKVRPIMQAIGYATGTFYNLFPSLGSLVLEINGQTLDQISSGMQTLLIEHDGR
ncbi:MAG: TetR/AcrR family transcriptional regulator, partial [Chlamydiia bacterium]|nr:TetR/AcrR family transcriptional regulator [Chlamydiia bacterium]